jgi:hypothetical protein
MTPHDEKPPSDLIERSEALKIAGVSDRRLRAAIDAGRVQAWSFDEPKYRGRAGTRTVQMVSRAQVTEFFQSKESASPQFVVDESLVGTHLCKITLRLNTPNAVGSALVSAIGGSESPPLHHDLFLRLTSQQVRDLQDGRQHGKFVAVMRGHGLDVADYVCYVVGR